MEARLMVVPAWLRSAVLFAGFAALAPFASAEETLGVIVDDSAAVLTGDWSKSTHSKPYYEEGYIYSPAVAGAKATYKLPLPEEGSYHLLICYSPGTNRAANALVRIVTPDGNTDIRIDQQKPLVGPGIFHDLGEHRFFGESVTVEISTEGVEKGVVIADAVRLLTADQLADAMKNEPKEFKPTVVAKNNPKKPAPNKPAADKPAKAEPAPVEAAPEFVRHKPAKERKKLTSAELDAILEPHLGKINDADLADDVAFLRRLTLDVIGRQPTPDELRAFAAETSPGKRTAAIEQLLASPEFGRNWARYWSDVISYRTPQPELTYLNYVPLQEWLAERFNRGEGWDRITYDLLTASGKVGENPAATFIGFHQADKSRLAAETTRVFLSTQIQCAECHDHKFIEMPQETFHHLAAFFVRVEAKLPWNDSNGILVSAKKAGEHRVPGGKQDLMPSAFGQRKVNLGDSDMTRRAALAEWIVSPENPWFAKAFANRAWARMMGRGFSEPVDEIGELGDGVLPEIHEAVSDHLIASEFDVRTLYRLIAGTKAYQRAVRDATVDEKRPFATMPAGKLRGDEIFESLAVGINLPNVTPEPVKPTAEIRFPPPPKSTRDLVNEAFGFDPSAGIEAAARSMQQAMFLMNNRQVQKQIDASPASETALAKLLDAEKDDAVAIKKLYERVLAREPNPKEAEIAKRHIDRLGNRSVAFEDLLWSLINSAEFTSRR